MKEIQSMSSTQRWRGKALLYVFIYLTLAGLWIVLSGKALDFLASSAEGRADLETYKGLFFVAMTTLTLYALLRSWQHQQPNMALLADDALLTPRNSLRLLALYLLGLVLVIAVGGYVVFENLKRNEMRRSEQNLSAVVQLKSEQISGWLDRNIHFATAATSGSYLASSFEQWVTEGRLPIEREQWVFQRLENLQQSYPFGPLALIDQRGRVMRVTGGGASPANDDRLPDLLRRALEERRPVIGDMRWRDNPDGSRTLSLPLVAPLLSAGSNGRATGAVLFEMNPPQFLFPLIATWPTDSQSAETMLIGRSGGKVQYLNELRDRGGMLLKSPGGHDDALLLAVKALSGQAGLLAGMDYRGVESLGYAAKISGTDWIIVAKLDADEVYQPIRQMAINVGLVTFSLALVGSLSLYYWWRQRRVQFETAKVRADLQTQRLEKQVNFLSKYANDIILLMDADGVIVEANDRALSAYGYEYQELIGKPITDLLAEPVEPDEIERYKRALWQSKSMLAEKRHRHRDGTTFNAEASIRLIQMGSGDFIQCIIRDITDRKVVEQRERRLRDTLRALGEINGAIMRMEEAASLFPLVCRIAVEFGGMALAWVGAPENDGGRIVPLASAGRAVGYLDTVTISSAPDLLESTGPTGTAYREQRVVVVNDFLKDDMTAHWREQAMTYGLSAIATFPISRPNATCAVLAVYSEQPGAFYSEIVELLKGAAQGISFALDNFSREAAHRRAENDLRQAATVFESSHGAIIITDSDARIIAVNPAFTQMTGYEEEEVIGRNPSMLSSGRQDADFYRQFWQTLAAEGHWQGEVWNRRRNGEEYACWLSVSALRDDSGAVRQYIGIADDITEVKESQNRIEFLAYHDALTGLPNRTLANDRLQQAIAHANRLRVRLAVLLLDLDDFKAINDTLGHSTGDLMLKAVADRLRACVRESDTVSRQGGDEFLVILNDVSDLDAINTVAVGMLEKIGRPYLIDNHELSISTSIGVAIYPDDGTDCDTLMKNADMAMYNAKQSGRNTHRFFAEEMNAYVLEHLLIRNGLLRALENKEFRLHYQPQLDLKTGKLIGAEALIRWQHPGLGMVSPSRFIPVAEESGMIVQIGNWVLQEACRQAKAWQQSGWPDFAVGVNISALQFRRGDLEQTVSATLNESGLAPPFLELELTESILIQDVERSLGTIERLKRLGVRLSIDDFGTGYSSLAYLRQMPVDKLKIDQSFVREISARQDDAAIALSIITLAHTLQKRVIAEGVETREQLQFMHEHGCDEIQGYLFSRPLAPEAFADFLSKGGRPDFLEMNR